MADPAAAPECRLLQGAPALAAQLVLAVVAFSALYLKRLRERPRRQLTVWTLDVSKQVVGMACAHGSGLAIAIIVHTISSTASQCAWYAVAFTFDTTLGVAATLGLHAAVMARLGRGKDLPGNHVSADSLPQLQAQAQQEAPQGPAPQGESWRAAIVACGSYGDPPSLRRWGLQAAEWAGCVVAARAACGTAVVALSPALEAAAGALDAAFAGHPTLLLFAVMVACPLLMNAAQLLLQDAGLRGRQRGGGDAQQTAGPQLSERAVLLHSGE